MGSDADALLWTRRHCVTTLKTMQLTKETQWELRLVKLICSFNQVLLVYCCLQSLLGFLSDCLTGQVEALQYEEEDWEAEVPVTARAAHLASLLPGIAAAVLGTLLAFNCGAALSKAKDERIVADPASIVQTIYH